MILNLIHILFLALLIGGFFIKFNKKVWDYFDTRPKLSNIYVWAFVVTGAISIITIIF